MEFKGSADFAKEIALCEVQLHPEGLGSLANENPTATYHTSANRSRQPARAPSSKAGTNRAMKMNDGR